MSKLNTARRRLQEILCESRDREFTLEELLWTVNWELDLEDMLRISTLKRACADLPSGCITRGKHKRLHIHARHFARREEVIAALKTLPHWDDDLPVLIERHKDALRKTLYLADNWALHQSLEWASAGAFEITHTVYGTMIRWGRTA